MARMQYFLLTLAAAGGAICGFAVIQMRINYLVSRQLKDLQKVSFHQTEAIKSMHDALVALTGYQPAPEAPRETIQ